MNITVAVAWIMATVIAGDAAPIVAAAMPAPQCPSAAFTLRANRNEGAFAGMSHDGAELDLRNVSNAICAVSPLPALTFRDASGATLRIAPGRGTAADGSSVNVEPGAVAVASVRYVSSDVFTKGRCFATRRLGLAVARHQALVWTPFQARVCGPRAGATVTRKPFTTAMEPLPGASAARPGVFLTEGPAGSTHAYALPTTITMVRDGAHRLRFTILPWGGGDVAPDSGFIGGKIRAASTSHWAPSTSRRSTLLACNLTFAFHGDRLLIDQASGCAFGANATAARRFRLDPAAKPVLHDPRAG